MTRWRLCNHPEVVMEDGGRGNGQRNYVEVRLA